MRASQLNQSMASIPPPAVQPTRVVDTVFTVPTFEPGPAGPRHQPMGAALPQNALASIWIHEAPPVAYSNMFELIRNPARPRTLASQVSLSVAVSSPGLPGVARFSVPGMPLKLLLLWPQATSPSAPRTQFPTCQL